jgi:broad-specificity NMP kinase
MGCQAPTSNKKKPCSRQLATKLYCTFHNNRLVTNLVAIVNGLPGCGKNHLCDEIATLGYNTADIDEWTQPFLKKNYKDFKQFKDNVQTQITAKIEKKLRDDKDKKYVLCGVSALGYDDGTKTEYVNIFKCDETKRYWLDITPKEWKDIDSNLDCELLNAARYAVLREFKKDNTAHWLTMSEQEREEEGLFWTYARPGEVDGPIDVPSSGLDALEFQELWDLNLKEFMARYRKYHDAMLNDMIKDGYMKNRTRALAQGFQPLSRSDILTELRNLSEKNKIKLLY